MTDELFEIVYPDKKVKLLSEAMLAYQHDRLFLKGVYGSKPKDAKKHKRKV